jgi:hypothetical protein
MLVFEVLKLQKPTFALFTIIQILCNYILAGSTHLKI